MSDEIIPRMKVKKRKSGRAHGKAAYSLLFCQENDAMRIQSFHARFGLNLIRRRHLNTLPICLLSAFSSAFLYVAIPRASPARGHLCHVAVGQLGIMRGRHIVRRGLATVHRRSRCVGCSTAVVRTGRFSLGDSRP